MLACRGAPAKLRGRGGAPASAKQNRQQLPQSDRIGKYRRESEP
jgi:hypothetical protein